MKKKLLSSIIALLVLLSIVSMGLSTCGPSGVKYVNSKTGAAMYIDEDLLSKLLAGWQNNDDGVLGEITFIIDQKKIVAKVYLEGSHLELIPEGEYAEYDEGYSLTYRFLESEFNVSYPFSRSLDPNRISGSYTKVK